MKKARSAKSTSSPNKHDMATNTLTGWHNPFLSSWNCRGWKEHTVSWGDRIKWFNISRSSLSDMLQVNSQYCVLHRSCSPWNSGFFWNFWNIYPNIWFGAGWITSRQPDTRGRLPALHWLECGVSLHVRLIQVSDCSLRVIVCVAKSHCASCKSFQNCQTWRYLLN